MQDNECGVPPVVEITCSWTRRRHQGTRIDVAGPFPQKQPVLDSGSHLCRARLPAWPFPRQRRRQTVPTAKSPTSCGRGLFDDEVHVWPREALGRTAFVRQRTTAADDW